MTVTDLSPTLIRRRVRTELSATPESQDLDRLQAMLDDVSLTGYHDEIREAIVRLTATSALAA